MTDSHSFKECLYINYSDAGKKKSNVQDILINIYLYNRMKFKIIYSSHE